MAGPDHRCSSQGKQSSDTPQAARSGQPRRALDPPEAGTRRAHPRVLHRRIATQRCYKGAQVTARIVFPSPTGSTHRMDLSCSGKHRRRCSASRRAHPGWPGRLHPLLVDSPPAVVSFTRFLAASWWAECDPTAVLPSRHRPGASGASRQASGSACRYTWRLPPANLGWTWRVPSRDPRERGCPLGWICRMRGASAARGNADMAVPIKLPEGLSSMGIATWGAA